MTRSACSIIAALALLALARALPAAAQPAYADWPDVATLHAAMRSGEISAAVLVERQLARIELLNPELNAVIAVDPTARAQARALDRRLDAGEWAGPLHGIPVLLKS